MTIASLLASLSRRPFCLATLLAFLAGCSGYSRVAPEYYAQGRDPTAESCPFAVGQKLKITLATGDVVEGDLRRFTGREIVLNVVDDGIPAERTIVVDDVTALKRHQFLWGPTTLGVGVVAAVASVFVVMERDAKATDDAAR